MSQFDWPIAKKKLKLWRLPQNRRFYGKMECVSVWPIHIGKKGMTLGKTHIGLNQGAIGSPHWELEGKMFGTKGKGHQDS